MIPVIGLMIGAYIVTRMASFLLRSGERSESVVVKILAVVTILVTCVCVYDLVARGGQPSPGLSSGLGGLR